MGSGGSDLWLFGSELIGGVMKSDWLVVSM